MAEGSALAGQGVEGGTAREPEPDQPRYLVERLARSIVERLAEHDVMQHLRHVHEHRVSAAHDQGHVRRLGRAVLQEVRPVVALQMVHADEVGASGERDRLGRGHAHEQRPHEARAHCDRDGVDLAEPDPGLPQALLEQRVERLHVCPRGHLGHDAPEALVQVHLRGDQVGTQVETVLDHRHRGLVARGLDAQRDHERRTCSGMSKAIASSRAA